MEGWLGFAPCVRRQARKPEKKNKNERKVVTASADCQNIEPFRKARTNPMKKLLLLSLSAAALLSYQASAQTTISITGTSGSINPTIGSTFDSAITLTISGTPPADVESVNLLLETPTTGASSGVQYFTDSATSGSASFPTLNNPG